MQLNETKEEYQYINNSHDKIFRKILDNKNEAISIINRVLERNITSEEIEKYNSSYISDNLRNSEADVVYKIKNQDVFFLIEHQTKIDYSMPYRILKYEVEIIESALIQKKEYKYPLVIPIVLYTGSKEWNAKMDLRKAQVKWDKYENKELSRYNIIDVNKINNEELLDEKSLVSKMLLIEKSDTKKEVELNLNRIIERKEMFNQEQKEFLITIIQLVLKKQLGEDKANKFIKRLRKENKKMLAVFEMIDRENAKLIRQGKREGKRAGKRETKIEYTKNMLKEKLPIELISKITGIKKEQIEKMQKDI